jgi:phosphoesterase RecJ-like protein
MRLDRVKGPPLQISARSATAAKRILAELGKARRIVAATHVRADGDGLGSALAFARIAQRLGVRADVAAELGVSPEYRFLPDAALVDGSLRESADALFAFDCGSRDRLGSIAEGLPPLVRIVNVDHHVSNTRFGAVNWVDSTFASTTEMVYVLARLAGVRIDSDMAVQLYTGLVTDTGGFSFSNTSPRTHRFAADLIERGVKPAHVSGWLYRQKTPGQLRLLSRVIESIQSSAGGAVAWAVMTLQMTEACGHYPHETQEYVNLIRSVKGVRVAILFRELREDPRIRISIRTSNGIDGAELAACFGGGGHRRASGAMVEGGVEEVVDRVVRRSLEFLTEADRDS